MGDFCVVSEFPSHINVVPWLHREGNRRFAKCAGLFWAHQDDDGLLVPRYGMVDFEILTDEMWNKLLQ